MQPFSALPLLPCRQKGFFVQSHRPDADAWYARRRSAHFRRSLALLVCGAVGLCPLALLAQPSKAPTYETVVVALPAATDVPREDGAAAASLITEDRTPRAGESVPQLLSEQAGVAVTRLGGMGSLATVSLRGSTANQVLVYVDGVPFNTATGGGVDLGAIPLGDVERIEIYRGMSPIAFGASGIGGVVSISTTVPKDNRIELEVGGGSFGTYHGGAQGTWNHGVLHVYGGVHALTTDGDFPYVDDNNTTQDPSDDRRVKRRNDDLHQVDGTLRAVTDLAGDSHVTTSVIFFDRAQGLPGPGSLAQPTARLGTLRATGILAYESNRDLGPGGRLRATAHGNYTLTHFQDLDHQINASPTDARDRTYSAGATLGWRRVARPWLMLSGVFDGHYDRFRPSDALGAVPSGAPATRLFGASGIESDFWIQPIGFDIIASLRLEAAREETSGRDFFGGFLATSSEVNHVLPVARLSFIKEVGPWISLRANAGRYARLPTTIELYGNTGYIQGNPGLRPESGVNADFGPVATWQRGTSSLSWSTAAFASWASDLILFQYGGARARAANLGSARILGVESSLTLVGGRHLRLFASGTFTDAQNTSSVDAYDGRQLPLRPRYRFYVRPEWRAVRVGARVALGAYADLDATAGNYRDPANTTRVPSRLLVGAGVFVDLPANFCLRASGQNLGNSQVNDLANYPLPGREFYLTLSWSAPNNGTKDN